MAWPDHQLKFFDHKVAAYSWLVMNRSWQSSLWTLAKFLYECIHELESQEIEKTKELNPAHANAFIRTGQLYPHIFNYTANNKIFKEKNNWPCKLKYGDSLSRLKVTKNKIWELRCRTYNFIKTTYDISLNSQISLLPLGFSPHLMVSNQATVSLSLFLILLVAW